MPEVLPERPFQHLQQDLLEELITGIPNLLPTSSGEDRAKALSDLDFNLPELELSKTRGAIRLDAKSASFSPYRVLKTLERPCGARVHLRR